MSTTDATRILAAMNDDDFREFVDKDLRRDSRQNIDPDLRAALRSEALVDRWLATLVRMAKSVEGTLAFRYDDFESEKAQMVANNDTPTQQANLRKEYHRKRAGTLRFKLGLDEYIVEARALRDSFRTGMYDSVVTDERNHYAARVKELECAIRQHQDAAVEEDLVPEPHDLKLWAVLA